MKLDGLFKWLALELCRAVRELHPELTVDEYALYRVFRCAAGDSVEVSSRHIES